MYTETIIFKDYMIGFNSFKIDNAAIINIELTHFLPKLLLSFFMFDPTHLFPPYFSLFTQLIHNSICSQLLFFSSLSSLFLGANALSSVLLFYSDL